MLAIGVSGMSLLGVVATAVAAGLVTLGVSVLAVVFATVVVCGFLALSVAVVVLGFVVDLLELAGVVDFLSLSVAFF